MTQLKMEYTFAVFTAIPLLFMATLNISHVEGMASDFSNILLEIVTSNSSYFTDYSVIQMEQNSWIVVNATTPEEDYSINVLIEDKHDFDIESNVPVIEISYSEAFLPDFSNLHVHFVSSEASEEIGYTFISMEEGSWAIVGLDRAPTDDETISIMSEYPVSQITEPENFVPNDNESSFLPEPANISTNKSNDKYHFPPENSSNQSGQVNGFGEISSDFSFEIYGAGFKSDAPVLINSNGAFGKALQKGKHDVHFTPPGIELKPGSEVPTSPVLGIHFKQLEVTPGSKARLGLESLPVSTTPFGKNSAQAYAIDPTALVFDNATVTIRAKGTELFKCAEWDFDSRVCNGEWVKLMDLIPGELYNLTITPDDPAFAEYNLALGAVRCANNSSPCIANSSRLRSRDSIAGTVEPNQPNTVDSCTDGGSGTYLNDESVENITITSLNGSTFNAGDTVNVTAWVYCWATGTSDNINFVYSSKATNPTWTVKAFANPCPGPGMQQVSRTFALDNVGGEHVVRVINQYLGSTAATCGAGAYDDNDDVAFQVNGTVAPQPGDAIMAYRSNTGVSGISSPKIRFFNASGTGSWGSEIELPSAGSPVRWVMAKWSPISDKIVVVSQADDGNLDGYTCLANCTRLSNWVYSSNIGVIGTGTSTRRRFAIEFETSTSDLVLLYGVLSTNTARDLGYKILPAASSSFTGLTEQYIDDTGHATDIQYAWIQLDRKPTNSEELIAAVFDITDTDINALVWNGNSWGNFVEISPTATATGSSRANAIRYAADGSKGMAMGADGTTGNVNTRYWNGAAWSSITTFDIDAGDALDLSWVTLKADPASDDLQAVLLDSGNDLHTGYWNGATWQLTSNIDTAVDTPNSHRKADFEWTTAGSTGRLVWDTDGVGTTLSQRTCSPQCTGGTTTFSTYAGTGRWLTMARNPQITGSVRILGTRLNSNMDIGTFAFTGAGYTNHGDAVITVDTTLDTRESYSTVFNITDRTKPYVAFISPTPPNNTGITVNYSFINVTATDNLGISSVLLEWNGTNQSMTQGVGTNWYLNKTGLTPGTYTYRVWAIDIAGNKNVTGTRVLTYGTPPSVIIIEPLGGTYDQYVHIPMVINVTDSDGINFSVANITYPNGTSVNLTLYSTPLGDDFDSAPSDMMWAVEDSLTGMSQTCIADIDTTVADKAYTSLSGDGTPETDTLCTLIANMPVYGDFDINISFEVLNRSGNDTAINFQLTEIPSSADAPRLAFIALSNWTGLGSNYEVFVDDGNVSDYIATRPSNDTSGKFRITRAGSNFTFYTWNSTSSSWILENSSDLNMSNALYISFESELAYPGWGIMDASWDNLSISATNYTYNAFHNATAVGTYNVTFYARDTLGTVNDSEKTNFTIAQINDPPSTPFFLAPSVGSTVYNNFNITWSSVNDEENNNLRFNITLLNSNYSFNSTIVTDYGNINSTKFLWNTSAYPDGNYSMLIEVYENDTPELYNNSYTLQGTFLINNTPNMPPSVIIIEPLGGTYADNKPVPLTINATDIIGIDSVYATITYPNTTEINITLYQPPHADNFNFDTVGIVWDVENDSIGPSQTCVADVDTTITDKAFTSLSGNGAPETDTLCSLVSKHTVYGDFDMNISFEVLARTGIDNSINFQIMDTSTSSGASSYAFIALSNWTGLGSNYEVFVDDGNTSDYIATRPTNDTSGKFRITRAGSNLTFYTWNSTASSWILENSSNLNMSNALFFAFESESAYPGWGTINASWDNLSIDFTDYWVNIFDSGTHPIGLYNVTFFANDTQGGINNTETSNFTVIDVNDAPSTPFILTPFPDEVAYGLYNITWSSVSDADFDALRFNITLLNANSTDNSTIVLNFGNNSSTYYEWDTTAYPDGEYSLRVTVYENETAEGLENSYTLTGTFFINNGVPSVIIIEPLGGTYADNKPVPLVINATDLDGIDSAYATVTYPNTTEINVTLYMPPHEDNFNFDTLGIVWSVENDSIGPSQTCIADIDTTVTDKAFTSISGNGAPETDTLCSLVSVHTVYGDFDMNISFEVLARTGIDNSINFQIMDTSTSSGASSYAFIALSNWTGLGSNYEVFVDDGNTSDYIATRPTNDTSGKFRITRVGSNFSFFTWNSTASSWIYENSSNLNMSNALFFAFESESAYPGWGTINASWDNISIAFTDYWLNNFNQGFHPVGLYNVTFFANDTLGRINNTEKSNFTVVDINNAPSTPFILTPYPDAAISGTYNITWSSVSDADFDALRFNITLLNSDLSDNASIISDYGNNSSTNYEWDTTAYPDGEYSLRVTVYENETAEGLENSYEIGGTFFINNNLPNVTIISPLGETYPDGRPVSISITAYDSNGINSSIAQITNPNSSMFNLTLGLGQQSDNFSTDTIGVNWMDEDTLTGPSQICIADIDTSVLGKAYTSLSGDGSPESDTLCSLISTKAIDGDFNITIDFNIENSTNQDYALNFQITEIDSSADASRLIFMALSNWTGQGQQYEIFADDGNYSDYILQRETNDTSGRFMMSRTGNNFTFYTWDSTNSSWNSENVSENNFNFSRAVYVSFESESAYSGWGTMEVTWDNFTVQDEGNLFNLFKNTYSLGLYNVTIFVTDNLGGLNDSEKTNFTIAFNNDPPSKPYILTPFNGAVISGLYNISGSNVNDEENDSLRINITLLNPDYSPNATIVSDYGNSSVTSYEWNTTAYPDGVYSLEVVFYENETAEGLSNSDILEGNFTIDNTPPLISFEPPTDPSGSTISNRDYIIINVTASDLTLNLIEVNIYNSSLDLINTTYHSSSPVYMNSSMLSPGLYYFNATAIDLANHSNSTETRNVTIAESSCMEISSPGDYGIFANIDGAPISGSPVSGTACVKISSSNVSLNCNGFNITNNGTAGTTYGIELNGSLTNVSVINCTIANYSIGIAVFNSSNGLLQNNTLRYNGIGIQIDPSYNNTVIQNNIYNNSQYGIYLLDSFNNSLLNNTAYNNSYGFLIEDSSNNSLTNNTAYNNGYDLYMNSSIAGAYLNVSRMSFLNPLGSIANYTVLSLNDTLDQNSAYYVNWTTNSTPTPLYRDSFEQKFVNISTDAGNVSIDSIVWHWLTSELSGYNESRFEIWKYNGSWSGSGSTLNAGANTLSLANLSPESTFGILQNNVPLAILNVTDSPDPEGYGLNVTILANITGADTILVGVTPPGGNETNYTMTNATPNIYTYDYSNWTNSTYYYIIYANDTNGIWYNSSTYNFTLAQNLTIQLKTLEDYYSTNQTINITDPPSAGSGPNIISASVNPEKVVPGDRMAITVYVSDPYGIESVQAVMPHELGNDTLILNQTSGSEFNGIWEGIWTVHDTIAKEYVSTIIAQNKNAETSTSYVTWFDPPGIWISPSSFTDPSGQWTNEANAMDGDTDTYASDNSNPGTGWGQFIIFNTTQIQSDSVRVWADYGPQVGSVDVDIYRDGGWINVHEGPVTNLKWYEINFTEGNLSAARFRYNYTVGGWIYWLYEMQFYNVSTQVNIPVAATRAATSVEETSGILHGVVNADGGTDCQLRFIYGTNESYGLSTPWTGPFYTGDSYGYWLTSLTNGQTYHFKVQINNSAGLANGSQKQFTAGPAGVGWLSPSNYSDPNGEWVNELYIMDDELSTEAESYHDANDPDGVWSFYLHLNRTPVILSDKIRFNAKAIDTDLAEVDIYTNGSWVNVFNGAFADKTYIVASYNMTNVSEARIRLRADSNTKGFFWQVYEFDFYKNILTALENQSRLDNNGTTNASCYLQMETQFWNGSSWIDDDLVVNDSSPRVLAPEDVLKLDLIWNPYNYSSNNLSYGEGIYRVYASCVDDVGNLLTNVNGSFVNASYNFTFDGTPPLVNITSPENNSNYTLTSTVPIHANVTDDVGVVLVQANVSNSLGYEIVTLSYNVTSGLWEYDFTNTVFVDTYTIQIIATDTSGNVNDTEWVVFNVLDITAPNVTLVSPSDNNYTESGAVTFTCNVTDNYDVSNVSLYITDENNQSFAFNQSDTVSGVSVSVDFNLTLPTGDYTWNCLAYDSSNNSDWGDANYSLRVVDLTSCPIIPFPGTYSQPINYVGAPNNATPLSDFVCVKITSSDVIYDCNGYNITDNGTAGTTYGVLLNGSLTNVTLQNCGISNYTNGIYVYQSNDSNITNHTSYSNNNGIVLDGSDNNYLADISSSDNSGYGMLLNSSTNNTVIDSNLTNNTLDGISIIEFNYNKITNLTSCHNGQNGIALHDVDFTTIDAAISCNNSMHGILLNISGDINITQSESYNNSDYGVYLYDSRRLNMTDSNSTNNTIGGIYFDNQSVSNSFSSDYICFNGFDINNQGSTNAGSLDTCDTFASWSENGHLGCEFACSSFWHRFFGDLNSSIVLTDAAATNNVHTWNASGFMVYFADYDSSIDWASLQAIGRTSTSTQSANDFTELDTAFNGTTYDDNINATYSTDGSLPIETRSYTVFQNTIANVPVANSTKQNTTFQTGILWDTNDGGTEYSNTLNQSTVWVVEVNASTVDAYGTYDYLISVPYTLSTYETNTDLVSVYIELQ